MFETFIEETKGGDYSLVVVNRSSPEPLQRMMEDLFTGQEIDVEELERETDEDDLVLLLEDGEIVASSPLVELQNSILLVNSDLYITGTKGIKDLHLPDVIENLDDIPFYLRGYPESNKEKLLLITISRFIEKVAWENSEGKLRSSFQKVSRINDEKGTRTVYSRLSETDVDVHVYGVPDWIPPMEIGVTLHGGYDEEFRKVWFVVYTPEKDDEEYVALVAVEVATREWKGFWTYDKEKVREINEYIKREM